MSSQSGDTIICLHPIFELGLQFDPFWIFVLRFTRLIQSFGVIGQNRKYEFFTMMHRKPTDKQAKNR